MSPAMGAIFGAAMVAPLVVLGAVTLFADWRDRR